MHISTKYGKLELIFNLNDDAILPNQTNMAKALNLHI